MATRQETARRRQELADHLRQITTDGSRQPGDRLPSLRELSARFGLSMPIVARVIKPLIDRGLIRTVRGQGMVIAAEQENGRTYAFVIGDKAFRELPNRPDLRPVQFGFERAVTESGGTCLTTTPSQLGSLLSGAQTPLDGVFSWSLLPDAVGAMLSARATPTVTSLYSGPDQRVAVDDLVGFDDFDGGRKATLHLIRRGHRDIAFLGFHRPHDSGAKRLWSRERERGCADALRAADPGVALRSFCVPGELDRPERAFESAARAAQEIVPHIADFDAVVAADDIVLLGLVGALRRAAVDPASWPAMVGFEGLPAAAQHACTSLFPDRELLGRTAARLLNERATGSYTGGRRTCLVGMTLVARISSRRKWGAQAEPLGLIPDVA